MKKRLINIVGILTLLIPSIFLLAQQNLVINPSFEEVWYCPPVLTQDSYPCKYWWVPNLSTPDYYNKCSRDPNLSVPYNDNGYCEPHTGDAYIGLIILSPDGYMEHIQGHLLEPLKANKKYQISFWIRLAYQFSDYSSYNIGILLSNKKILTGEKWEIKENYIPAMTPELTAQISNKKENFITDTIWKEISGTYIAKGGEKYITVGVFWDDNPKVVKEWENARASGEIKHFSKVVKRNMLKKNFFMEKKYKNALSKNSMHFPYYFIDDVSVIEIKKSERE